MKMNKIYLITGPAGVGKSTISSLIAEGLDKSVLLEGDTIYHFVCGGYESPWKEGNHLELFWQNSISLIKNSLINGYDVVFNYILHKSDVEKIKKEFSDCEIKFICLMADEKTILNRDKLRIPDNQMGERCIVLLNNFKKQNFDERHIIDTSFLTQEEVYKKILSDKNFII